MKSLASFLNNQSFNSLYDKCKKNRDMPKLSSQKKAPVKLQGLLKEIPVFASVEKKIEKLYRDTIEATISLIL